jgi:hypothetical protein
MREPRGRHARIVEVPYIFHERARSASKAGWKQLWLYALMLARLARRK